MNVCTLIAKSERRATSLKQVSRNSNIEPKNVRSVKHKSLTDTVEKLGEVVKKIIAMSDVDVGHRVPAYIDWCPHIIVQYKSRSKGKAPLQEAQSNVSDCSSCGFPRTFPMFVNEQVVAIIKKKTERKKRKKGVGADASLFV